LITREYHTKQHTHLSLITGYFTSSSPQYMHVQVKEWREGRKSEAKAQSNCSN
jgi:hypothetical protein